MNKTKVIVSIVSIILVLAVATGLVGYFTNGFKDWFGDNKAPVEDIPTPDPVPEVKEKSVAFDLKLVYNEDMDAYSSALTPEQNRALLEYPNATFFADVTVDRVEGKVTKHIPLIYFSMCEFDPASPFVTYGFSDSGALECTVAFVVNGVVGLEEPEIFVICMEKASIKFELTYAEDSVSVAKPAIDYANSIKEITIDASNADEWTPYSDGKLGYYKIIDSAEGADVVIPAKNDCSGKVIYPATESSDERVIDVTYHYSLEKEPILNNAGTPDAWFYIHKWVAKADKSYGLEITTVGNTNDIFIVGVLCEDHVILKFNSPFES